METTSNKFCLIHEMCQHEDNLLSVSALCRTANVSRSGYYRWVAAEAAREKREAQDLLDFELIQQAYQFRGYDKGARGIHMRLLHLPNAIVMNVKKIRRLMKKYGMHCPIRKANPYRRIAKALKTSNVAENLVNREFAEHGPRAVLLTDITYIPFQSGFCYLSVIIDAFTKQVLSYVLSASLEVDFVLLTVRQLMENHGDSLRSDTLIHSDQGCHYTSYSFIQILKDAQLRQSMSRRGNCWDNAPQESFFGHLKDELNFASCKSFEELSDAIDDWMDYYNNERYQWQLKKLSPNEFYNYFLTGVYPLNYNH